jgi:hypothetical protein
MNKIFTLTLFILFIFVSPFIYAETADENVTDNSKTSPSLLAPFTNKDIDFFPVPVFETRPDEGESYGLMPVLVFADKESKAITTILAAIGQYNSITKFSGATVFFYYPNAIENPNEVFEFYFEFAQKYYRELDLHYFNPKFLDKFFLDSEFLWLKTPFGRFYGFGAGSTEAGESNFVSRNFSFDTTFGYYLHEKLRVNLTERFTTTDLLTRGISTVQDTLTTYGALPGVNDATNLIHKLSVSFDTRPNLDSSRKGTFVEGSYFFSIKDFLSDNNINGYSLEAKQLLPWWQGRTVTALRFYIQDMYGTGIPFNLQSGLGGAFEMRSFIPDRFRDTGKAVLTWEQRIKVWEHEFFGINVELHADPFIEVGRVFNHLQNFSFDDMQVVGGIGLRAFVPPNVLARIDIAVGSEGYNIYTMLNYPF